MEQTMTRSIFTTGACSVALIATAAGIGVRAQDTAGPSADTSAARAEEPNAQLSRADRKFVEDAAAGGLTEVQWGRLAQQKAANEQVKQFAAWPQGVSAAVKAGR
jgi:putative membrane protein